MSISRTLARPLLASIFLVGPINTLRNSSGAAKKAESVTDPLARLAQRAGLPIANDPEKLVKINAGVQIAAGLCLATGRFPRLSAAVLAGSLVPTTIAGHDFWNESDPAVRRQQQLQFAKNLSLLGGLIIAAGDTDGKPGVAWLAKHSLGEAKRELGHRATTAKLEGKVAALEAEAGVGVLGTALLAAGQHAKDAILETAHQAATSDTTHHLAERASEVASSIADAANTVTALKLHVSYRWRSEWCRKIFANASSSTLWKKLRKKPTVTSVPGSSGANIFAVCLPKAAVRISFTPWPRKKITLAGAI